MAAIFSRPQCVNMVSMMTFHTFNKYTVRLHLSEANIAKFVFTRRHFTLKRWAIYRHLARAINKSNDQNIEHKTRSWINNLVTMEFPQRRVNFIVKSNTRQHFFSLCGRWRFNAVPPNAYLPCVIICSLYACLLQSLCLEYCRASVGKALNIIIQ